MKKNILFAGFFLFTFNFFAQINPVPKLDWNQWYQCPYNFYRLEWRSPVPGQDTLIGYNVYRDNQLYRFQTDTILNFENPTVNGNNDDGSFINYNNGHFWMHVTAVYNHDKIESGYIDSAECQGIALNTNDLQKSILEIYPNPASKNLKINIKDKLVKVQLIDAKANIIEKIPVNNEIDISSLSKGIYFIKIFTQKQTYFNKVIIE